MPTDLDMMWEGYKDNIFRALKVLLMITLFPLWILGLIISIFDRE